MPNNIFANFYNFQFMQRFICQSWNIKLKLE